MRISKNGIFALKLAVTSLLLFLVFRVADPRRIADDLGRMETGRLVVLALVCWTAQFLCTQRWRLLSSSLGMPGPYHSFLSMYFLGMLFNIGLPSMVGGDIVKAFMITRKNRAPIYLGLASVFQDRAIGLAALLLFGGLAAWARPLQWRSIPLLAIYSAVAIGMMLAILLIWKGERLYRPWITPGSSSLPQRLLSLAWDFHRSLASMKLSSPALLQIAAISIANAVLSLWMFHQVTVAAGHQVDFLAFSQLIPLITLVTMLPVSLGGIGIREWAYLEALSLLHVPSNVALTVALTSSALIIVTDLAGIFSLPFIPAELRSGVEPS
jgi:uncharacterized protein (TIRG00374 family)